MRSSRGGLRLLRPTSAMKRLLPAIIAPLLSMFPQPKRA